MSTYDDSSLFLYPSGYKASVLFAQKPMDANGQLAFTRSNDTATRVDENGLIEKVRTNLALYSEQFDNAAWVKVGTTVTANDAVSPDGYTNADALVENTATTTRYTSQQFTKAASSLTYALTIYYKNASGTRNLALGITNGTSSGKAAIFTTSGTITATNITIGTGLGFTFVSADVQSVANGFYRASVVVTTDTATRVDSVVYITDSTTSISSYTGNGTSGLYLFGAQLETGDIATDYIATTTAAVSVGPLANIPRIDYLGGGCGKLLLEPQRTNLAPQSENFNGWSFKVNVTTTANYAVSPDGYTNADRLQFTGAGFMYGATGFIQTNGTTYTLSCYAKRNGSGTQSVGFFVNGSGVVNSAWTLTSEWQRFTYTYTASNNSSVGIAGANGADVSVYGFQFEAGAYATSYIPTLAASVTRGADACSKTGISSLIGQTEGTLFIDFQYNQPTSDANGRLLQVYGTSDVTNSILPLIQGVGASANQFQLTTYSGGSLLVAIPPSASTLVPFGRQKFAIAYNAGVYTVYRNGSLFASGTGASPASLTAMELGSTTFATRNLSNPINQAILFNTRLPNSELASMTTL